jgi:hypothetical protein
MSNAEPSAPLTLDVPRVFERSGWQNIVRWLALGVILAMDTMCVLSTVQHAMAQGATGAFIGKQLISYVLLFICNCAVLPSIIFEAKRVEAFEDRLVIYNLLYKKTLRWEDIRQVVAPMFLKFAILKTQRFFYLINKRDVERFQDLIQIIRDKAESATKS